MMRKRNKLNIFPVSLILLLFINIAFIATAEEIQIPEGTTNIEQQAFLGCESIEKVWIPQSVKVIGQEAFKGCSQLREIIVASVETQIEEDALNDCETNLWLHCKPESAAADYARFNNFDYDADTHYRALIIGQNYTGTNMVLYGPSNDASAVRFCLTEMEKTSWSVTQKTNLTAQGILNTISSTFGAATEDDVSLIYFSGHGDTDGSLIGSDILPVTPNALRKQLDVIPGRKIIIVDACYSGQLIDNSQSMLLMAPKGDFCSSFMSAFSRQSKGVLNTGNYFVIVSSGPRELSEEGNVYSGTSTKILGYFTFALCRGLGWDGVTSRAIDTRADLDSNGAVSIIEAATYASREASGYNDSQHAAWWPQDSDWFAPFRK